jgi:hypothetical protein
MSTHPLPKLASTRQASGVVGVAAAEEEEEEEDARRAAAAIPPLLVAVAVVAAVAQARPTRPTSAAAASLPAMLGRDARDPLLDGTRFAAGGLVPLCGRRVRFGFCARRPKGQFCCGTSRGHSRDRCRLHKRFEL